MLRFFPPLRRFSVTRPLLYELAAGILRLLFLITACLVFALVCIRRLEGVDVLRAAELMRQSATYPYSKMPVAIWMAVIPFLQWEYFRYMFAPVGAFLFVFVGAVLYVRDIYHLPSVGRAFHYVFSSLFALFYPVVRVDGGRIDNQDPEDERVEDQNLLRAIGGPGFVRIQPGNAVAFRDWRTTGAVKTNRLYFMRPFEMIARVVSLEDQHGHIEEMPAITRDGIRLHLKNIDYRFTVLSDEKYRGNQPRKRWDRGHTVPRNQRVPYPFSEAAVETIAYSFAVADKGLEPWHAAVKRVLSGALVEFISAHDLDYLTAPRQNGQNPRRELRVELFGPALQGELRRWGTELHWIDIGQFDFDDLDEEKAQDPVDTTRTKFWAVNWVGSAKTIRSYGEAKHLAYQELGRAEAQAEMIMCITDALRNVRLGTDKAENLRHIFLARTAQILEAVRENRKKE